MGVLEVLGVLEVPEVPEGKGVLGSGDGGSWFRR